MNDKYIRLFQEEDETLDISLCDRALKLCKVLEDSIREDLSKEDIFEDLDRLINIINKLKTNETLEHSKTSQELAR